MASPAIFIGPTTIADVRYFQPSIDVFDISEALFDADCPIDPRVLGEVGAVLMKGLLGISGIETIEIKIHGLLLIQKASEADWAELKPLVVSELKAAFGVLLEKVVVEDTTASS